jgi:NADP-dependent 3-hydroxy acid dehydrogenase YdfG
MQPTIVVTGCTKGIGKAIVLAFAKKGFNIAGCARNKGELSQLLGNIQLINPTGTHVLAVCDVSKPEEITGFAKKLTDTYGFVDILVNNAGVFLPGQLIDEDSAQLPLLLQTNVVSAYLITKQLLPAMRERKRGHIFNICSIASLQAYPHGGSYTISKFALLGFSKQLRQELKNDLIRVTAVMPGATLTNSWAGTDLPDERFIQADDVAKTILSIYELSDSTDVEEIIIRPQLGDI